jgi:hypothetical protein
MYCKCTCLQLEQTAARARNHCQKTTVAKCHCHNRLHGQGLICSLHTSCFLCLFVRGAAAAAAPAAAPPPPPPSSSLRPPHAHQPPECLLLIKGKSQLEVAVDSNQLKPGHAPQELDLLHGELPLRHALDHAACKLLAVIQRDANRAV